MINVECQNVPMVNCSLGENSNKAKAFCFSAPAYCCGSPTQAALNCKNVSILNNRVKRQSGV